MTVRRSALFIGFAFACALAASPPAFAQALCPNSPRPALELVLDVTPPDRFIATALENHLRAELDARGIDVCQGSVAPRTRIALVRLLIERSPQGTVVATLRVRDEVTDKTVERTMDLSRLPVDARPTAVAASTDELLRASWVELAINDAPPPRTTPPAALLNAVAASLAPRASAARPATVLSPRFEIGALFSSTFFFGSREAFGGLLTAHVWAHPRVALTIHAGGHVGLARTSVFGEARGNDLLAGLGVAFAVTPNTGRVGLQIEVDASALRVTFDATPVPGAYASNAIDWTITLNGRGRFWLQTGRVRWVVGLGVPGALRAVRATDGTATVTALQGVGLDATAGVHIGL